jgi:malonate-semialdehyde dehydrogenase (acetylating)/methylmalonate-semialdehyde dehydrogenase
VLENYIDGAWTPSSSSELSDVVNPATGEVLARVPLSTSADLDRAVAAARAAFPEWRLRSTIDRARWLFGLREGMSARHDELARSVTREMGKTLPDARAEVSRMIEMVECATAIPTTMQGRNLEGVATNVDCETVRQPVGVCAAIVPFNFPAMVPMWFLPFAIACGNTFILKPSEQVPTTQQIVFDIIDGLDLPPGVVNLVNGGKDVVNGILTHPGIDAVSFVGSAAVARHVYSTAAAHGKRVQALGGAKNHIVVLPDAVMDKTVDGIIGSAFGAAGQRCMAGSVVVTVGDAHARLLEKLRPATEALRVGDGMEDGVAVGPLVSRAAQERVQGWIEKGLAEGARLIVDGRDPDAPAEGAFVGPTIVQVEPHMEIAKEEVFGPVLSIVNVGSFDEAIALVNSSRYGNGTSIFTESGAAARRYRRDVEVGMIGVNIGVAAPVAFFPFSGWKDSFLGDLHAHGGDAVEFFTRKKTVTSRWYGDEGEVHGSFFVEMPASDGKE